MDQHDRFAGAEILIVQIDGLAAAALAGFDEAHEILCDGIE